jgi:lipopolysaccharide exporter
VPNVKLFNLKGDLFAAGVSFGAQALIKLSSSIILTRILRPEAYGLITLLMSIVFVVELLADMNVTVFIIREQNSEEPRYLNTAWTIRLARAALNTTVVFLAAPLIATTFYSAPELTNPLRIFSLFFLIGGFESMAYVLALRRKQSRIIMYSELVAAFLSSVFSVVYCYFSRDYWGMIYGVLLNRLLMAAFSYRFFQEFRPKFQFDRATARQILKFSKFTMPSSLLTIVMTQFDKIVFLRLFDLRLLGFYGLAGNIASQIESLVIKISNQVLYPRLAHNFRTDPGGSSLKYYTENVRLFVSILVLPAAICGGAHLLIALLYDPRYAQAADVLQAFMLRAILLALTTPAEDRLIAAGVFHVMLVGNIYRAIWMCVMSLTGYYFFGFMGFTYGAALSPLPSLLYYSWLQRKMGMMIAKYELLKFGFIASVTLGAYATSRLMLWYWPGIRISIHH